MIHAYPFSLTGCRLHRKIGGSASPRGEGLGLSWVVRGNKINTTEVHGGTRVAGIEVLASGVHIEGHTFLIRQIDDRMDSIGSGGKDVRGDTKPVVVADFKRKKVWSDFAIQIPL